MFCAPDHVFDGTEGVGCRFHVLRSRTRFRRYGGRAGSRFHVLRSQTRFRWYRGRRVPFSYFELLYSFSAVPNAPGPVFMFCAPILIFGGPESDESRFHVLRAGTSFWRYGGRRVSFSCFALPDTFSTVRRASGPVFMFWAPGLFFGGNEGAESRFHVLRSRSRFPRYRGRRVPFSSFAFPDSFSAVPRASRPFSCFALPISFLAVPRASGPVFIFCASGLILDGTEFVGSRFHVLRAPNSFSTVPRASNLVFMFFAPGHFFGGTEGVGSHFSCFALSDTFLAVQKA
jgi:hypothetical protein